MADAKQFAELNARISRLESVFQRMPNVDPAPDDWGWGGGGLSNLAKWLRRIPIPFPEPNPGDPVTVDFSRLSRAQLNLWLGHIQAERIRLDALENTLKEQLQAVKAVK